MGIRQKNKTSIFDKILNPDSVAIIGATDEFPKPGAWMSANFAACGYRGMVYPVHPHKDTVFNLKAYRSIGEIPGKVDLAEIIVPAPLVPGIMEECGRKGVKAAIVATSGFGEVGNESLDGKLKSVAKKWGIRYLGPNCLGVYNSLNSLNTSSIPIYPKKDSLAIISQAGSAAWHNLVTLKRMGMGVSKVIHTGNEADIDCIDCLEYLSGDPDTEVIGMYIEGIKRGREFLKVAGRVSEEKPIIMVKAGRTEAGARAARSHTSALAGSNRIYEVALRKAGILQAKSMDELFDWAFALNHQPLLAGDRIGILTHSGGPGVSIADACVELGLRVPELSQETQEKLKELLPPVGSPKNPVDIDFSTNLEKIVIPCMEIVACDPGIDGLIAYPFIGPSTLEGYKNISEPYFNMASEMWLKFTDSFLKSAKELIRELKKPILTVTWLLDLHDPVVTRCMEAGIQVFFTVERAASTMAILHQRRNYQENYSVSKSGYTIEAEGA